MLCAANVMLTSLHCTRRGCRGGGAGAEPGPGHAGHQRAAAQPRRGGRLQRLGVLGVSSTSVTIYCDAVTTLQGRALPPHLRPLHRQHQLHPRGHVQPGRPARRAARAGDHAVYIIMNICISTAPSAGELLADLPAVPHPAGGAAGRLRPESPRRLRSAGG